MGNTGREEFTNARSISSLHPFRLPQVEVDRKAYSVFV